jgi:methylthioribose-1-phosphate isomerase
MFETINWTSAAGYMYDGVRMIDQRALPREVRYVTCQTWQEVAEAIRNLTIRGAPAIGVAAAMGVALGVSRSTAADRAALQPEFETVCQELAATRPTAVNLFWAIARMRALFESMPEATVDEIREALVTEAKRVLAEDIEICREIGRHGATVVPPTGSLMTHCNAGALATGGYGTALGVIRAARDGGREMHVYSCETRPVLQGARLTAWELHEDNIPVTLITDNMAGSVLRKGKVGMIVVGADRIASNGDVANKIGTYSLAVLAKENGVPFYVAAPISTLDLTLPSGDDIPIEQRNAREVTHVGDTMVAPDGVAVFNPAFDVTPNRYVAGIITEHGVARAPYEESLKRLAANAPA